MAEVVLDASAILALLRREKGFEKVEAVADSASVSAVNLAEVGSYFTEAGQPIAKVKTILQALRMRIVPFDEDQAIEAARLQPLTQHLGLSLADRACLGLARLRREPAMTTDRAWRTLSLGIDVNVIR